LAIVLSILQLTASDYDFSIFTLLAIVLSILQLTASDYDFSIFTLLAIILSIFQLTASDYDFSIFKNVLYLREMNLSFNNNCIILINHVVY
jgi:hypothetical protein